MTAAVERKAAATTASTILRGPAVNWARAGWLLLALPALGLFVAALPARFAALAAVEPGYRPALARLGMSAHGSAVYFMACELAVPLAYALAAALIFWRRSDDWMALLISLNLILVGVTTPPVIAALLPGRPALRVPLDVLTALGLGMALIGYYLFPDGRFVPRWSRWLAAACAAWVTVDFSTQSAPGLALPPLARTLIYVAIYASGLLSQVYRYARVSGPLQRQQTKWAVWGFVPAFVGFTVYNLSLQSIPSLAQPGYERLVFLLVASPLYVAALILVPVALLFAALRYRLWDIDLLLSRSVVYGALTGLLGLMFLGMVVLLQSIFPRLTGGQQSGLALASAALVMGALFQPARRRLRAWMDRRYFPEAARAETEEHGPWSGLRPGARFGPYEVEELLGRGGMAEVYRGRHTALDRTVALKVLTPSLAGQGNFRKRFEREARTVAALKHPNIVEVFDFGERDGLYYMALAYVPGPDLAAHLHERRRLSLAQTQAIAAELASALDYAHEQGVVHRDVKPSNVLLRPNADAPDRFEAVLTDFGIARITGTTTERLTATGALGTLEYIAPEQILAAARIDGRADVYALGVMAYEMLTGRLPFTGDNPGALVLAHLQQKPPDPRQARPDLPDAAVGAILRALAKGPDDRFATAGDFARALQPPPAAGKYPSTR